MYGPFARPLVVLGAVLISAFLAAGCGEDTSGSTSAQGQSKVPATTVAPDVDNGPPKASTCLEEDNGIAAVVAADAKDLTGRSITLLTHDSFILSDETLEAFSEETGIDVDVVQGSDAGALVAEAILTKDNPTADVLFGIDNSFLCRGLEADVFIPYESPGLDTVDDALELDPFHRVTPISYGDVCVNYWIDALPGDPPDVLDDLADPVNAGQFVTQNPETSSPGFAFLLATIATFGEQGWEQYWESLVDNDVAVTAGWNDAYYGEFVAGGGDRSMVTSYASSPPAEFLFAESPLDAPPTGVLADSCFRQIEFAGILAGSDEPEAAAALIDFMLAPTYQADIPLNMFVYPANGEVDLPAAFTEFGQLTADPITVDPVTIEANRDRWTARWTDIVLG